MKVLKIYWKVFFLIIGLLFTTVSLISCSDGQPSSNANSESSPTVVKESEQTTDSIIQIFKSASLPIGKVETYDASTDPNNLLGRPKQYIAKANWEDTRVKQIGTTLKGGTVEIFSSAQDLESRKSYLGGFQGAGLVGGFYIYVKDNALIRVDSELTPDQAAGYENALKNANEGPGS